MRWIFSRFNPDIALNFSGAEGLRDGAVFGQLFI
jgi:hypothetical protein